MKQIWFTAIASILMMGLALLFGLLGKPTEMGLMIVAGAIAISFLNIDRIQRFKGAGFEAEMKLAVEHVHATVDQLRLMAAASAESTLTTLMAENFFDGSTLATRLDLHDRLIQSLVEIGVPSNKIASANDRWRKGVGVIYHRGVRHYLEGRTQKSHINYDASPAVLAASSEFQDLLKFENWDAPSAQQMREFINDRGLMNSEVEKLLKDYAHFEVTSEIQRRDVFVNL
ncbi:hypothetical protein MCEMIEM13_01801 [Comamonadaceae bacterium]